MEKIEILKSLSIETISDAMDYLGLHGLIRGMIPISKCKKSVGIAYTVKFRTGSAKDECVAADYIDNVPSNSIILVDNEDSSYCSVWGEILTITAITKSINGVVINGACRDISFNSESDFPIFARHITCKTGKGIVILESTQSPIRIQDVIINPGDYVVAEGCCIIVIPDRNFDDVVQTATIIEKMENNIINAVKSGMLLRDARYRFKYNMYK